MFHVGQKVVCVKQAYPENWGYGDEVWPSKGEVYTVRHTEIEDGEQFIRVNEIHNTPRQYDFEFDEPSFASDGFRPAVEKRTDISIFTDILKTVETPPREKVGG